MERILRPVWAEIDLNAIEYNTKNIKKIVGDKELIAVVKADCYGHGACEIAPTLLKSGASRFAVAMLSEAIKLRNSGITSPIMILGYTPIELADELIKYDIEQTVYDLSYAEELSKLAEMLHKKAKIHLALDTGMGRIGFFPNEESLNDINTINGLKGIEIIGMFTHFSTSDEADKSYTNKQFNKITSFIEKLKNQGIDIPLKHASNSGAIIDMPETYLDAVRAGIILYGYYPSNEVMKKKLSIKPALTVKAKIAHVKTMDEGMYISYGRTYQTSRKSIIATIPMGYADGYLRELSSKGKVIINGQFAPIVGRVCMDQFMVDVTDIPNVHTGDEAILLGESNGLKITADEFAEMAGTINYEIICMLKDRIPRVYLQDGEIVKIKNNI